MNLELCTPCPGTYNFCVYQVKAKHETNEYLISLEIGVYHIMNFG